MRHGMRHKTRHEEHAVPERPTMQNFKMKKRSPRMEESMTESPCRTSHDGEGHTKVSYDGEGGDGESMLESLTMETNMSESTTRETTMPEITPGSRTMERTVTESPYRKSHDGQSHVGESHYGSFGTVSH